MVDKRYPAIAQLMVDQRNSSYYENACMKDKDYNEAWGCFMECYELLTQLFMKQNPSEDDAAQFSKYLTRLDNDGHSEMLSNAVDYSYMDGFITASKIFFEIAKG